MENSILISTKKKVNLAENYTAFDLEIITFINSAFSNLNQLGVGPADAFVIEDSRSKWEDLNLPTNQLSLVKTYIGLKVRMLFDPPATSFHITAMEKEIEQQEWRLREFREGFIEEVDV